MVLADEKLEGKESNSALNFVTRGGELLKRTRKGKQRTLPRYIHAAIVN